MDTFILLILKTVFFILRLLPNIVRISLLASLIKLFLNITSKHKKIAKKNLSFCFPEKSEKEKEEIFIKSLTELGRLMSDMIRLPIMKEEWGKNHITFENLHELKALEARNTAGIIISSGHLGSFEVLARGLALYGLCPSFIARNFAYPAVDDWWKKQRNMFGNTMINREGAFKKVIRNLKSGRHVGILYDQNITRNHAIFVDFFGIKAATTKTLALAALQTKAPFVTMTIRHTKNDQYVIRWEELDLKEIYSNREMSKNDKVYTITKLASEALEKHIKDYPEGWFWMHRRWKTRPLETDKNLYS